MINVQKDLINNNKLSLALMYINIFMSPSSALLKENYNTLVEVSCDVPTLVKVAHYVCLIILQSLNNMLILLTLRHVIIHGC